MPIWAGVLSSILLFIFGIFLGFFITKKVFKKQIKDNPPITEKQIRAMYMSMGRKPSEADIKKTMNAFKRGL